MVANFRDRGPWVIDAKTRKELFGTERESVIGFSSDGRVLVTKKGKLDEPGAVSYWDVDTRQRTVRLDNLEIRPEFWRYMRLIGAARSVVWSSDATKLAVTNVSESKKQSIRIVDANTGSQLLELATGQTPWLFSSDGRKLCTIGRRQYRTREGQLPMIKEGQLRIWDVDVALSQRHFASKEAQEIRRTGRAPSRKAAKVLQEHTPPASASSTMGSERRQVGFGVNPSRVDFIDKIRFSDCGRWILTAGWSSVFEVKERSPILQRKETYSVNVWNGSTGVLVDRFVHSSEVRAFDLSRDGEKLLSCDDEKNLRLWDVAAGKELRLFKEPGDPDCVTFSPNGTTFVSAGVEGPAILWDTAKEEKRSVFEGARSPARFSEDGDRLLTGGKDGSVILWEVSSGQEVQRFRGGEQEKLTLFAAFTPNEEYVVARSFEAVIIWNVSSGKEVRRFVLTARDLPEADAWAFSTNGEKIFVFSEGGLYELGMFDGQKQCKFTSGYPIKSADIAAGGIRVALVRQRIWGVSGYERRAGRYWLWDRRDFRKGMGYYPGWDPSDSLPFRHWLIPKGELWNATEGEMMCELWSFTDDTWAVLGRDYRFDASNEGDMKWMWLTLEPARQLPTVVSFDEVKTGYRDRGLLAKCMGLNKEPFREVPSDILDVIGSFAVFGRATGTSP